MPPLEVLKLALSKEIEAIGTYQKLLTDPIVKDIFYFLVSGEQKHKQLIEKKIVGLTG